MHYFGLALPPHVVCGSGLITFIGLPFTFYMGAVLFIIIIIYCCQFEMREEK